MEIISWIGFLFAFLFVVRIFQQKFGLKTWIYLGLAISIWMLPSILNSLGLQVNSTIDNLYRTGMQYFNFAKEWLVDTYQSIVNK